MPQIAPIRLDDGTIIYNQQLRRKRTEYETATF